MKSTFARMECIYMMTVDAHKGNQASASKTKDEFDSDYGNAYMT